jgi:[heparan sulfate]-glucosamine 3-sulfotransferase 5
MGCARWGRVRGASSQWGIAVVVTCCCALLTAGIWRVWAAALRSSLRNAAREWSPRSQLTATTSVLNASSARVADGTRGRLWLGHEDWPAGLDLYSPDMLMARTGGYCNNLPARSTSRVEHGSIRAVQRRVVIDERCKPTVDHLDAGVCVQVDVGRRLYVGCLPSAIIIGFQKCATAELQSWLSAHPALLRWQGNVDQRSGAGEADFFKVHGQSSATVDSAWLEHYVKAGLMLRQPSDAESVYTFEKSPNYASGMPASQVAQLRRLVPSVKLIALVREPAARAYSGFQHTCKKGRVFQIDADIPKTSRNATRRQLRTLLAGRVILANSKVEAEEGLRRRFGTFSIYREYIIPLTYPCPPVTFSNFLGLEVISTATATGGKPDLTAPRLTTQHLLDNVFDFRDDVGHGRKVTTIVTHGYYEKHLEVYAAKFPREQISVLFMEDLLKQTLKTLTAIQQFLGVPWFDYVPFVVSNSKGQIVPSFSKSKATAAEHLHVPPRAHATLLEHFASHNTRLAAFLGDGRVERLWHTTTTSTTPG